MILIKQSTTQHKLLFFMTDSADHISGKTGLTTTVTISKAGGTFASPSGAVTELANGWYQVAANATDTNTLGAILLHATATGADPFDGVVADIVAFDPTDAVRMGVTALPNANAEAAGGLYTRGSGAGQIAQTNNGRVDTDVKSIANGVIAAATFAANALDAVWSTTTRTLSNGAITASTFAAGALDAVWSTTTRILTAGTNIVLAKGTGITGFNDLDASGVRGAVGLASANLDTQLSGINSKTTNLPPDPADASDIAASFASVPTANQNADALLDRAAGVETGLTMRQHMRLAAAALFGKASGLGTATAIYRNFGDTKARITATVDVDGNRTAVTTDAT